jgi:hypothetical protein
VWCENGAGAEEADSRFAGSTASRPNRLQHNGSNTAGCSQAETFVVDPWQAFDATGWRSRDRRHTWVSHHRSGGRVANVSASPRSYPPPCTAPRFPPTGVTGAGTTVTGGAGVADPGAGAVGRRRRGRDTN